MIVVGSGSFLVFGLCVRVCVGRRAECRAAECGLSPRPPPARPPHTADRHGRRQRQTAEPPRGGQRQRQGQRKRQESTGTLGPEHWVAYIFHIVSEQGLYELHIPLIRALGAIFFIIRATSVCGTWHSVE